MSDTAKPARPRQLTMAGGFVIGGSVLLVLSIFDTITSLQSVEMREEITKVVTSPTGEGLGLSVSEALSAMRVGLMIAGACAAAAAVLGVYALQRNRAARVALTVLAVPILLLSPLTGGLIGALVAAASLALWSGQARDWFAGRPIREVGPLITPRESSSPGKGPWEQSMPRPEDRTEAPPSDQPADDEGAPSPNVSSLSTAGSSTAPGATSGFGQPTAQRANPQSAEAHQGWAPPAYAEPRGSAVPVTVKVACILTWVFSGMVALMYAGMLVALVVAQDRIVDYVVQQPAWQRSELEQGVLVPVLWVGCLMFLGWSLGACLLARFTWRRHNWARWLLLASAGATVVAALFAFPVGLLHQLAAVLTIAGLLSAAARTWFAPRPWSPGPPPPGSHQAPDPATQLPGPPPPQYPSDSSGSGQGTSAPGGKPPVW
jgi:hypothetical protein